MLAVTHAQTRNPGLLLIMLLDRPPEALRRELRIAQPHRYAPLGG